MTDPAEVGSSWRVVAGALVRRRRPWVLALLWVLTAGISGAVWHLRVNRELRDYGRARGAMPFPFIQVIPAAAFIGYLVGIGMWFLVVLVWITELSAGLPDAAAEVSELLSLMLLVASLWLTGRNTAMRVHTAQMLAGVEQRRIRPLWAAFMVAVFPVYQVYVQRHLNRTWDLYRQHGGAHAPS